VTAGLFLDRDGVLNVLPPNGGYVLEADQLEVLPDVAAALARIREVVPDLRVIVVTNQRAVALGLLDEAALEGIHARLVDELGAEGATIDAIEVCPHDSGGVCDCRKPEVGLLRRAVEEYPDIELGRSALVGDSAIDIVAGSRFGVPTWLVGGAERRARERSGAAGYGVMPDAEAESLAALADDPAFLDWLSGGSGAVAGAVATASTVG
jgi:D-glycero-D-manno-heptose 1,7-bisphosphate phosphatase